MSTVSDCEIVISCIQNIISCCSCFICCCAVPACHILGICCDRYFCRFTRCKFVCLLIVKKLNCCFLYKVLFIIICIRSRSIKLYNIFTGHISCIGYSHLCCYCLVLKIYIQAVQRLCKCCIRKSVTKWIRNFTVVSPCTTCGTSYTVRCISLSENSICITCFIIFVSCVNAFCLYDF